MSPLNHVFADGSWGNGDTKLDQFAVNAWSTPQGIGLAHRPNQGNGLWADSLPTGIARAAFPFPEETESFAMPSDHGVRLNDQNVRLPGVPVLGNAALPQGALPVGYSQERAMDSPSAAVRRALLPAVSSICRARRQ